jgi:hypothetical protein
MSFLPRYHPPASKGVRMPRNVGALGAFVGSLDVPLVP